MKKEITKAKWKSLNDARHKFEDSIAFKKKRYAGGDPLRFPLVAKRNPFDGNLCVVDNKGRGVIIGLWESGFRVPDIVIKNIVDYANAGHNIKDPVIARALNMISDDTPLILTSKKHTSMSKTKLPKFKFRKLK